MNPELRDFKFDWVELPMRGSGYWFLHLWTKHGDDTTTEMWLTTIQAESMGIRREVYCDIPEIAHQEAQPAPEIQCPHGYVHGDCAKCLGEAQPVADAPSEWRKTRGYCLTCNLWMQFADQMEDCKSKGHDLRIPPWPATSPAPRDAESLREEIRDAIITDQATSAADYGEAEAYAERIVGPRESTRGGDWRAVDEHGTKRNPERERGNIPAGSSDSGTQDGQTADGLRPTK